MATLIEASFKLMQLHREIHGTGAAETLFGGVIGDTIYTGAGNDVVYAGSGNDTIEATSFGSGSVWAAWGNDTVHAGSGDDHINYGQTTSDVTLFGDRGNDWITAGQAMITSMAETGTTGSTVTPAMTPYTVTTPWASVVTTPSMAEKDATPSTAAAAMISSGVATA
jgi:Ca2+-binding RTX toxin-like protein